MVKFFVPGKAAPGGSKTYFKGNMAPANKNTKPWMAVVSAYAREAYGGELLTGPLFCSMEFRRLRPKGHYRTNGTLCLKGQANPYPTTMPDLTKLVRATEDALTGIIFRDDSQVVKQEMSKVYVGRDPGVMITVREILC